MKSSLVAAREVATASTPRRPSPGAIRTVPCWVVNVVHLDRWVDRGWSPPWVLVRETIKKTIGKWWLNGHWRWKTIEKCWFYAGRMGNSYGKTIEQQWENDGTWWFNGGLMGFYEIYLVVTCIAVEDGQFLLGKLTINSHFYQLCWITRGCPLVI